MTGYCRAMTTSPNEPADNDQTGTESDQSSDLTDTGIDDGQLPEDLQPSDDNPLADPEGQPVGEQSASGSDDSDDPADQPTNDPTGGTPL